MALMKKNKKQDAAEQRTVIQPSEVTVPVAGLTSEVEFATAAPAGADAFVVAVTKGEEGLELPGTALLDAAATREVFDALTAVGATGKAEEITKLPAPSKVDASYLVAVGLGDAEDLAEDTVRRAAGTAARAVKGADTVVTTLGDFGLGAAVEGFILGGYSHRGVRSTEAGEGERPAAKVLFLDSASKGAKGKNAKGAQAVVDKARIIATETAFARNLVNTTSNFLYPESYADALVAKAGKLGLAVEVLEENELEAQGFGGILAVGKGSQRPPRLVRLTWEPKKLKKNAKSVALVGKGITFDTGGISLKPGNGMWDMISDMGGSAAVAATVFAAAQLELPIKVTATLPLAENMPSGSATRPGDVIVHYGGLTSEVLNTDAEGRLVLADAIARASEDKPDYLIETATLTGAQIVALGNRTAGVMGTDEFRDRVAELGREVGENAWAMPLLAEHDEDIKSKTADIRNIHIGRDGGMEFAGTYLSQFVGEGIEWVHIDVAGPSWNGSGARGYTVPRSTGVPTRTMIAALEDIAAQA